ncbi:unnamed protein product [Penicillium camemberti]|uniref:Str. FM013 n=1 Tax=Penicillium camemberti (strain FM 013) TaxID=1429867 RepID=A0A0G4PRJ8_PENC3|nr:unnamed protein product [Penicillium camemberti]
MRKQGIHGTNPPHPNSGKPIRRTIHGSFLENLGALYAVDSRELPITGLFDRGGMFPRPDIENQRSRHTELDDP